MVKDLGALLLAASATAAFAGPPTTTPVVATVKAGAMRVKGGELYYEITGAGPTVVLIHAGLLDHRMWDGQFDAFAREFKVLRYDARGHGRSSLPYGQLYNHEDLHELLVGLHLTHAVLVGVSLGARTAVDFTLEYPKMVDGLVLVSPEVSGWEFKDPILGDARKNMNAAAEKGDLDAYVDGFERAWLDGPRRKPGEVDPKLREAVRVMARANVERMAAGEDVRVVELGALPRLGEIRKQVLVIAGALDMQDILNIADLLGSRIAGARKVIVPGVGHLLNLEKPAEFNRMVLDFLRGLPAVQRKTSTPRSSDR